MVWKPVDKPSKEEMAVFLKDHRKIARFLVDESVGIEVASQMKELGLNVKYVDDVGLRAGAYWVATRPNRRTARGCRVEQ